MSEVKVKVKDGVLISFLFEDLKLKKKKNFPRDR